jgi:hypothetical protein
MIRLRGERASSPDGNELASAAQRSRQPAAVGELRLERYGTEHVVAARAFNERMRAAHATTPFLLPEAASTPSPDGTTPPVAQQQYIVLEREAVRGGVIVQQHQHWMAGETRIAWNLQAPLSEGIVDRRYSCVAGFLMNELLRRNALLYSVGMGSAALPYPRLLRALRWRLDEVPFYFRVCHARTFLREARALRSSTSRRVLFDLAALSGIGPLGIRLLQEARRASLTGGPAVSQQISAFDTWADEVWQEARPDYGWCAARDQSTLSCLYPEKLDRLKLRVQLRGKTIGWAVALVRDLRDHKYFGSLRLGMIVDCMAPQQYAPYVVRAAAAALEDIRVDLIVSNQSHGAWRAAFKRSGFLSGPSNYLLGVSPGLSASMRARDCELAHVNRGDGDGTVNL